MPPIIEKAEQLSLPVVTLHGTVAFPAIPFNFELSDASSSAAVKQAGAGNALIFLVFTKVPVPASVSPSAEQLYRVGTLAKIKQMIRSPEGDTRIIAEGLSRAMVTEFRKVGSYLEADLICKTVALPDNGGIRGEAFVHELLDSLRGNLHFLPTGSEDLIQTASLFEDPGLLADFIAANILVRNQDKQTVLECFDPFRRCETLLRILEQESELMETEAKIRRTVNDRMNRNQKEYYLREQIKAIQEELGESAGDAQDYAAKIRAAKYPKQVEAKLLKETDRLAKTPYGSAEATVLGNYLDVCLEIPWNKSSKDKTDYHAVQKTLDADHYGLEKVKERIVEYIAAKQLNPDLKNQILCLVGPPGVGKTSIAASIAKAMNRKYVRISLGGVRDEADIRGHRKTYIGAMPGRIITALTQSGVNNPFILLDEIDKLTSDSHGDPTSALLEVLDSEQNKSFRDHFVELPFDLSGCVFFATANSLDRIPRPLLDRMEIIQLGIYTRREKLEIAKSYLIPKQLKRHGLTKRNLKISDDAVNELIDYYTREAGVRNLEREIAALCRKAGKKMLTEGIKQVCIGAEDVESYLGVRKMLPEAVEPRDEVGCVNGLAYTELGGTLLKVEVAVLEGTGKIETTGSLGDVMKESARIAVSYVRSVASKYGIPTDFYKNKDIHIHFPEGATPKDGPSAGVTMVTALISALTGRAVRHEVAMTGEISLRGKVLAIGGLKEKTMAAYAAGATTVFLPEENEKDLEEIDPLAKENLHFVPCRLISEVLDGALLPGVPLGTLPKETTTTGKFIPIQESAPELRFSETGLK